MFKKIILNGLLFILLNGLVLSACNPKSAIEIKAPWARPAALGNNTAAYFVIVNNIDSNDNLLSASSEISQFTQVHLSMMQDGNMVMQEQEFVNIPGKGSVEFKPKSYHIMFINLTKDLNSGDSFILKLNFENAGEITVEVPVKEQ